MSGHLQDIFNSYQDWEGYFYMEYLIPFLTVNDILILSYNISKDQNNRVVGIQRPLLIVDGESEIFYNSIPNQLGICLTHLISLNLCEFQLQGEIPETITNLVCLEKLKLDCNMLHGSIPNSIGNMKNLEYLDLSSNYLTGSIPETIWLLHKCKMIFLGSNRLNGIIPNGMNDMKSLCRLSLERNELFGLIPDNIVLLSQLYLLNLSSNNISGFQGSMNIPVNLRWFSMTHNNIPDDIKDKIREELQKLNSRCSINI